MDNLFVIEVSQKFEDERLVGLLDLPLRYFLYYDRFLYLGIRKVILADVFPFSQKVI